MRAILICNDKKNVVSCTHFSSTIKAFGITDVKTTVEVFDSEVQRWIRKLFENTIPFKMIVDMKETKPKKHAIIEKALIRRVNTTQLSRSSVKQTAQIVGADVQIRLGSWLDILPEKLVFT